MFVEHVFDLYEEHEDTCTEWLSRLYRLYIFYVYGTRACLRRAELSAQLFLFVFWRFLLLALFWYTKNVFPSISKAQPNTSE